MMARGEHAANQFGRVLHTDLFHDLGAMVFDRSRTQPKLAPGFLVGRSGGDLRQHVLLATGQGFAPWKAERTYPSTGVTVGCPWKRACSFQIGRASCRERV